MRKVTAGKIDGFHCYIGCLSDRYDRIMTSHNFLTINHQFVQYHLYEVEILASLWDLPVSALFTAHPCPVLGQRGAAPALGGGGHPVVREHLHHLGLAHLLALGADLNHVGGGHGYHDLGLVAAPTYEWTYDLRYKGRIHLIRIQSIA